MKDEFNLIILGLIYLTKKVLDRNFHTSLTVVAKSLIANTN